MPRTLRSTRTASQARVVGIVLICLMPLVMAAGHLGEAAQATRTASEIVGLVEIPKLLGDRNQAEHAASARETLVNPRREQVRLRREPRAASAVSVVVGSPDDLMKRDLDFLEPLSEHLFGAYVFARSQGWSLLRLYDGRTGWLSPNDAGLFHSLTQLMMRAEFFSGDDTPMLANSPGDQKRFPVPPDPRRVIAGYLERVSSGLPIRVLEEPRSNATVIGEVSDNPNSFRLNSLGAWTPRPVEDGVIAFSQRPGWFEVGVATQTNEWRTIRRVWIEDNPTVWKLHRLPAA